MNTTARRGFSVVDLVVTVVVIATLFAMIAPMLCTVREQDQRLKCQNNLKNLVLALHNYHDQFGGFPASAQSTVTTNPPDTDGYSLWVELLPHLELKPLLDQIKAEDERSNPRNRNPLKNSVAAAGRVSALLCPGYTGAAYLDAENQKQAITNYKAMSATHRESLERAVNAEAKPKYRELWGHPKGHPDGGLTPVVKRKLRDLIDGTSNTMLLVETIDSTNSYWAAGSTASLVAFPPKVEFVVHEQRYTATDGYVAGKYGAEANYKYPATYFNWDYDGKGDDAGPYDTAKKMTHGPSSPHAQVVNTAFGDGTARGIAKDVDQSLLMFVVTRAGNDPSGEFFWRYPDTVAEPPRFEWPRLQDFFGPPRPAPDAKRDGEK